MAYAFDTLGYAKRLRDAGISMLEAEAHAEAAREFIMAELVTRADLNTSITAVREEMAAMRRDFRSALDNMGLRLTIRLGAMLVVAIAALATIIKL